MKALWGAARQSPPAAPSGRGRNKTAAVAALPLKRRPPPSNAAD